MTTSSLIFIRNGDQRSLSGFFQTFIISVGANADSVMTIKFWTMARSLGLPGQTLVLPTIVVGMAFSIFRYPVSCF